MPACPYADMNANSGGLEEQRALQLAFELSILGMNSEDEPNTGPPAPPPSTINTPFEDGPRKRSANMTECVPVPSSEHVAEIVGRQGCKIKALRAKTNTYIKTPVRGEEPVFVVTGRKEDVGAAKREILSAAEHFSQIRASRRNSSVSSVSSNGSNLTPGPPSPNAPGQITLQVRVPYRVVGLVVGPKGATIKRIQQQTHTYIVTPSRDKEPVFEVTGLPDNVDKARQEIESHIAMRTGGVVDTSNGLANGHHANTDDFPPTHSNGIDSGFHELTNEFIGSSMFKPGSSSSAFTSFSNSSSINGSGAITRRSQEATVFNFPPVNGTSSSSKLADFPSSLSNGFSGFNGFSVYDNDEGIGSPSFDHVPPSPASMWPDYSDNHSNRNSLVSLFGNTVSSSTTNSSIAARRSNSFAGGISSARVSPPLMAENDTMNANHTHTGCPSAPNNGSPTPTSQQSSIGDRDHGIIRRICSDPSSNGITALSNGKALTSNGLNGFPSPLGGSSFAAVGTVPSTTSPVSTMGVTVVPGSPPSLSSSTPTSEVNGIVGGVRSCGVIGSSMSGSVLTNASRRNCFICSEREVVAALVPCGHNLFCMDCAMRIVDKPETERSCPVCQMIPSQAIRILS